jgi:hypothetical protein
MEAERSFSYFRRLITEDEVRREMERLQRQA